MAPPSSTRTHLFAAIAILAVFGLGCQYFQLPEHLQSEAAIENPRRTIPDAPVFLNNEDSGNISDIGRPSKSGSIDLESQPIDRKLAEITKLREVNGVLLEGTNAVASNVYLVANPDLSVEAFAKLYIAIDQAAGFIYIPKNPTPDPPSDTRKPSPMFLAVHTEKVDGARTYLGTLPDYDPEFSFSYDIEVEIAKSADQLKSTRMWEDSFEISADERFFINEKQGPEADYGPRFSRVKQRPVDEGQLRYELNKLPTTSDRKLIIVSERASCGRLLSTLALVDEPRAKFRIVVRPDNYPPE